MCLGRSTQPTGSLPPFGEHFQTITQQLDLVWPFRILHNCTAQSYQDHRSQKYAVRHRRHQRTQKGQVARSCHKPCAVTDRFDDGNRVLKSPRVSGFVRDLQAYPTPDTGVVELQDCPMASSAWCPSSFRQRLLRICETQSSEPGAVFPGRRYDVAGMINHRSGQFVTR